MNRVEQAKLSRFYIHLIEFIENLGHGENDFTDLMSRSLSLSEEAQKDIREAAQSVFFERDHPDLVTPQYTARKESFIQKIEEKVLSLQGER